MNPLFKSIVCLALLGGTAYAELNSGLTLSDRTDKERILFLSNVAKAYSEEKDFSASVNAYERILEIDPNNTEARYIIGLAYVSAKQYKKAEEEIQSLIEEDPNNFRLLNNLAWLYATAEDPAYRDGIKAVKIAQQAMVIAPNDHHVWSTLAEAYYVAGEYEKAFRAVNQMATLTTRYGQKEVSKETIEGYNEQIRKCKRAWDTQKLFEEETKSEE